MKYIALLFFPILFFSSCGKELETVTVKPDQSDLFASPDSVADAANNITADEFIHIKIGEISAVKSLDPLFATTNSEWRIISLLYEGLVGLDKDGNLAPAIARRWQVNEDSTQFKFFLKSNKRFHSSPVFDGGRGRPVKASDVQFAFQRMAAAQVPSISASGFNDIRGFRAFQAERQQLTSDKWVYSSIEGIRIQNDSTLTFILQQPAPDFLKRLAHPMASIYAPESVNKLSEPIQQATGTGIFRFIRKDGETYLLTMVKSPRGNNPHINRLDVVSGMSEKDLYQQFAQEKLDALLEPGPSTRTALTDSSGNFLEEYYHNYELVNTGILSAYSIFYNKEFENKELIYGFLSSLSQTDITDNSTISSVEFLQNFKQDEVDPGSQNGQIIVTNTSNPIRIYMLNKMATTAAPHGISLGMNASYAMWTDVALSFYPYPNTSEILRWKSPVYILNHKNKVRITVEHQPWNMTINPAQKTGRN